MGFLIGGHPGKTAVRAVLFDMDGLLVDSERLSVEEDLAVTAEMGWPAERSLVMGMLGVTDEECRRRFHEALPGLDLDRFYEVVRARFYERIEREGLPRKPGAKELLDRVRALGIPYALATSSGALRIERCLKAAGLDGMFPVRATAAEIEHSKPAPDIFLLAADKLGVPYEACLVLEDSPSGVRAGRAAGMQVCMVPDMLPFDPALAPFADHVCDDLNDVITLLPGA